MSQRGFSLIETVMALGVLTVGLMGAAAVITTGMQKVSSSPFDLIATQKAAEAIESVFSARDSHVLVWANLRNVVGTGTDGGIFLDGPQSIRLLGSDGLFNTAIGAAQPVETMQFPGPDQILNTADDVTVSLAGYTREIQIRDVPGEVDVNGVSNLRSVTVTVIFQGGLRKYTLVTYISNYS